MTEELEAFGLCFVEEAFFFPVFPLSELSSGKSWSFRGHRFHHHLRSQSAYRLTPFIVSPDHTLCFIFSTETRTFRLHYSNSFQMCPLSKTRKGYSSSSDVSLTRLGQKLHYIRVRPQNVCSTRDLDSPRRPPFCCAKNAWFCARVIHAKNILVI